MASKHFAIMMLFRVLLLLITLVALTNLVVHSNFLITSLLLSGVLTLQIIELYRFLNITNKEVARFLSAAKVEDFSQQFHFANSGAGHLELSESLNEVMSNFQSQQQNQELRLRHLSSLIEHIPVPLISIFNNDDVQLHNNAARQLFGNAKVTQIDDLQQFGQSFADLITHIEPGQRQLISFKDGETERQLSVQSSMISAANRVASLVSLQDIQTELDETQQQAWQDLVKVLTHEIMNSITPVASLSKTAVDLLNEWQTSIANGHEQQDKEQIQDVYEAVTTVAQRAENLMTFVQQYRSLAQQPQLRTHPFDLPKLLNESASLFAESWKEKEIKCHIEITPAVQSLTADPELIQQILINLLKNAEQVLSDTVDAQISIRAGLSQRGKIYISVADNGPGVAEELRDKIFVPFFTTKQNGSGIGLALARQIMIAHGGNISLSSEGETKFSLVF